MKRILALTLALAGLLCGCGSKAEPPRAPEAPVIEAPAPEAAAPLEETMETLPAETEPAPTEAPQVYFNPLNGEILDAPFTGRIFANTISNIPDAIPHVGVTQADILMEMYVNNSIVRCLALYTDMAPVEAIGSTRSTRLMFNMIAQHYDLVLSHAGGSSFCLDDANERGLDHFNIDSLMRQGDPLMQGTAYRDKEYKQGEHNLFGIGKGIMDYAESTGVRMTQDHDYLLTFADDGTPADGEDAPKIDITLTYATAKKNTTMEYDTELGKYVYYQYDKKMVDQITEETEAFENVIVMFAGMEGVKYSGATYQKADFLAGGEGYFACGGKIVPITWSCDSETSPFRFMTADGGQLDLGRGNTYIAICSPESQVTWGSAAE